MYPWLDQTSADPSRHLFGVFAQDAEPAFMYSLMLGEAIGIPVSLLALAVSSWLLRRERRRRRGDGAKEAARNATEVAGFASVSG